MTKEKNDDKWYTTTQNIQANHATDSQHVSDKVFLLAFVEYTLSSSNIAFSFDHSSSVSINRGMTISFSLVLGSELYEIATYAENSNKDQQPLDTLDAI